MSQIVKSGTSGERRFAAIFEQSQVPTQLYSADGRILACNSAWYRWMRLTAKDVDALNARGYRLLEDPALTRTGVVDCFRKALGGTAVQTPAIFYDLADQGLPERSMWRQANFYPIQDERGDIAEVLILHHDVSELMEAKRAAEHALALGMEVANHAPVAVQVYDAMGYSIYTNEQHTRIFGAPPPAGYCVLKDSLVEAAGTLPLIHGAFKGETGVLPLFWYNPADLALSGTDAEYTKRFGRRCAIETHMIPIRRGGGEITHVVFIFKDVTGELFMREERERALKERDDARTLIQNVLDQTRAVIYIKDAEGRFLFVNGQFCRIFDKAPADILGRSNHELFPKNLADEFWRNDRQVLETGNHVESDEVAVHADGSSHTYLSLKFPVRDSEGAIYGICGISTDITRFRALERELDTAKRMEALGLLAGGIAHNFNNSLGVILLAADTLLLRGGGGKTGLRSSVESIKAAARSGALLTRQLLAFGRRQPTRPRNLDLGTIVAGMSEILDNALGEDIRLSLRIASRLWPVLADPVQIEQILANLCFNARDAMPRGGRLRIGVRNVTLSPESGAWRIGKPAGRYVELTVKDDGTGIAPANLPRVFEPFFTTKSEIGGSGLGLATVYDAVKAAGGDIAVGSEPGKGALFTICLPRADGAVAWRAPAQALSGRRGARAAGTLLLVEDEPVLRRVSAALLRRRGYGVIEASDAKSALACWGKSGGKIDLVISDIVMPGLDGVEMARKMARSRDGRDFKVLFISAYSEGRRSDREFAPGACRFLEKPYDADGLLAAVSELLKAGKKAGTSSRRGRART